VVAEEAQDSMQAVSGVNLDEEAANLLRYQQAYMAISQMIRVADSCFQSVLQATRG
jgi:flagellar hook-associated protein 1 FlgK